MTAPQYVVVVFVSDVPREVIGPLSQYYARRLALGIERLGESESPRPTAYVMPLSPIGAGS